MACSRSTLEGAQTANPGVSEDGTSTRPDGAEETASLVAFSADARPDDGTPFVSWDTGRTVPFLVEQGDAGGRPHSAWVSGTLRPGPSA